MAPRGLVPRIADTKILYFEAKRPYSRLSSCTDQPINLFFYCVVEVSKCFWTVPGQSGAELPISFP